MADDSDQNKIDEIIKQLQTNTTDAKIFMDRVIELETLCGSNGEHFSDRLRNAFSERKFSKVFNRLDTSSFQEQLEGLSDEEKIQRLLTYPFFNYPISTDDQENTTFAHISRSTVSASAAHYEVYFEHWHTCDKPIDEVIASIAKDALVNKQQDDWGDDWHVDMQSKILSLFESSFTTFQSTNDESSQKENLFSAINKILDFFFNYKAIAKTEPDLYFTYKHKSNEIIKIVYGEAKNTFKAFIPEPLGKGESHHYCFYGFGLELANYQTNGSIPTYKFRQQIRFPTCAGSSKRQISQQPPKSSIVQNLLKCKHQSTDFKKMKESTEVVVKTVDDSTITRDNQKYASNLFVSTMQATLHSVKYRKNMSIVISGRVTMFIKLEVNANGKCIIRTSDLVMNGAKDYIPRLLFFLKGANPNKGGEEMSQESQDEWKSALDEDEQKMSSKKETGNITSGNDGSNDGDDSSPNGSNNGDGSSPDGSNYDNSDQGGGNSKRDFGDGSQGGPDPKKSKSGEHPCSNNESHNSLHGCQTQATCKVPLTLRRRVTEDSAGSSVSYVSDKDAFEGTGGKILLSDPFASSEMDSCTIDNLSIKSDHEDTFSSARTEEINATMTLKDQVLWQHALSPYKESVFEDGVRYLGRDEDGILVPYLHQIKEEEKVKEGPIGEGRCGEVRKIPWKDGYAAVKHFRKGDDIYDEKYQIEPIDAYKHELEVFRALKSVWGVYIPELLFHTSWTAWRPSIGMELGTGMPDDFNAWSSDDITMRDEAMKAVSNLGYVQDDMRGANFIRLHKSGLIAMIDFESFVKVEQQN